MTEVAGLIHIIGRDRHRLRLYLRKHGIDPADLTATELLFAAEDYLRLMVSADAHMSSVMGEGVSLTDIVRDIAERTGINAGSMLLPTRRDRPASTLTTEERQQMDAMDLEVLGLL